MLKIKPKLKLFLVFYLWILFGSLVSLAQNGHEPSISFLIKGSFPIQPLPSPHWVLKEGTQALTADEVRLGNWKDASLIDLSKNRNLKSPDSGSYWFKINLSSEIDFVDFKILIERYNPNSWYDVDQTISSLRAYYFKGNIRIGEGFSGREMPTSKRDLRDFYYQSILVLDLAAGETLDIWINYEGPKGYISPTVQLHPPDFQLSPAPWPFKLTTYNFYLGFLCTLLIIGLFLLFWFKGTVYVWFLGFIVLNIFTITYWRNSTLIIHSFFPENSVNYQQFGFMLDMTKWGILILFGRIFIQTKKFFPRIDKALLILGFVFILLSVIMISVGVRPNLKDQNLILLAFFGAVMISILGVFGYLIISKNLLARFFSIGAIIPFIGIGLIAVFREILWVRNLSELLMSLGPMVTLTLAIVYRFRQEALGRIQAEKEKSYLLENQTIMLEKQVNARTAELKESIEHLKATQGQLIQQEKLASLGQLTAGIAHEIQNPLNFVNNFSELSSELIDEMNEELDKGDVEEAKFIASDIKQNLEKIHHHGKRADGIVKGMLQHSRKGSGEKTPTDINALADEFLRLSYHGLRAKDKSFNADFSTDFDPTLPLVNVVAQDIGRVLLNLFNNAFQACAQRKSYEEENDFDFAPMVTVSTKNLGNKIEIKVTDNGSGIPDEIKDKIFQPFFTTKPTGQGTGLGLSLSYDIVKAHGGELKVETKKGKGLPSGQGGTEFIIKLLT